MKRILALTSLWLFAVVAIAQAPIGVCLNNVAQTISNGVIAPIPYATVALCTAGSTASNCIANKVNIFTSTALSTATPTNPFTADAGGNYFFCAAVGHYGVLISSSYGTFFVNDFALVDEWSKGGIVTGNWIITGNETISGTSTATGGYNGALAGNASTASASNHNPTQCATGLYSQGDSTTWAANCAQVNWSQLGSVPSFYYQIAMFNGTPQTQRPALNFSQRFSLTDSSTQTTINANAPGTGSIVATETANPGSSTAIAAFDGNGNIAPVGSTYFTVQSNGYGYWIQFPGGYKHEWGCYSSSSSSGFYVQFPSAYTTLASVATNCTDSKSVTGTPLSCANTTVNGTYAFNSNGDQFCWSSDGY